MKRAQTWWVAKNVYTGEMAEVASQNVQRVITELRRQVQIGQKLEREPIWRTLHVNGWRIVKAGEV